MSNTRELPNRSGHEHDGITDPHVSCCADGWKDTDVTPMMLLSSTRDSPVAGHIELSVRSHDATKAGTHRRDPDVAADLERSSAPPVLDEPGLVGCGLDDDVRAKAAGIELSIP